MFIAYLKKFDWALVISAVSLSAIGLLFLYFFCVNSGDFFNFQKQLIFFGVGLSLMILFSFFDLRILRNKSFLIGGFYFFSLALLIGLFFFAPQIRGAKGWYRLGPISLDPIELIKIVLIIMLAKYFSMRHIEMYRIRHIILSGLYVLLPCVLIFFQPDLGSVLILFILWVGILIVSGIKLRHFLILCLLTIVVFASSWSLLLKPYHKERIVSFVYSQGLGTEVEALGVSWSQIQSKIAIGSGGIFGKGIGQGPQTQHGFLSEPHTDLFFLR